MRVTTQQIGASTFDSILLQVFYLYRICVRTGVQGSKATPSTERNCACDPPRSCETCMHKMVFRRSARISHFVRSAYLNTIQIHARAMTTSSSLSYWSGKDITLKNSNQHHFLHIDDCCRTTLLGILDNAVHAQQKVCLLSLTIGQCFH